MEITQLRMHHFRCMTEAELAFAPGINLIHGLNGSGKTSILEAIYFLSLARSFRSRQHRMVIQHEAKACQLHAKLRHDGVESTIGVERGLTGAGQQKLNGERLETVAPLAQHLPVCLLHPERLRWLSAGPKSRRQLLDWGLFYQEPAFLGLWQRSQQALKQRNAALRRGCSAAEVGVWSDLLCQVAPEIDGMRANYLAELGVLLNALCDRLFAQPLALSWGYMRGWPQEMRLEEALSGHFGRDLAMGCTQHGPHRADFALKSHHYPVHQVLSQGQQKLLANAVLLAQAQLLCRKASAVLLVDDLPAELDHRSIQAVSEVILEMQLQTFVTGITLEALPTLQSAPHTQRFHVEQGMVTEGAVV